MSDSKHCIINEASETDAATKQSAGEDTVLGTSCSVWDTVLDPVELQEQRQHGDQSEEYEYPEIVVTYAGLARDNECNIEANTVEFSLGADTDTQNSMSCNQKKFSITSHEIDNLVYYQIDCKDGHELPKAFLDDSLPGEPSPLAGMTIEGDDETNNIFPAVIPVPVYDSDEEEESVYPVFIPELIPAPGGSFASVSTACSAGMDAE
ncbi:unnamed protein product [Amoebophrya sp. A120]|nr:unnamed protein product [Amoebophrya sp. A120]|eukprot:GSA120T00003671001.1